MKVQGFNTPLTFGIRAKEMKPGGKIRGQEGNFHEIKLVIPAHKDFNRGNNNVIVIMPGQDKVFPEAVSFPNNQKINEVPEIDGLCYVPPGNSVR